ncbi:MAG: hypothetical protein HN700_19560, partial [Verrucomicrobia bacterium]|nr:hypothetical protein [Verrucomicrobiota bacterium]
KSMRKSHSHQVRQHHHQQQQQQQHHHRISLPPPPPTTTSTSTTTINSNSTHDAVLIGEVSGASSSNITDITVAPKTSYRYRVDAVNANGMRSPGAELILVTLAGMDYPFIDTAEGSDALWLNESPWAISDEQSYGPGHAWSDSPGTNYTNGINTVLRLAAPLDLTATTAPALSFVHQLDFQGGDSANAEVSPDGGTNWITLGTYNGSTDNAGPVPLRGCPVREDTIATGYCIWQMILPE